jgi:glutathione synthase/RimK-type ligase-like ATP-grasp enzyme
MILVVSARSDGHAQEILSRVAARGRQAVLLDLSTFPVGAALTIGIDPSGREISARVEGLASSVDLAACRVVWWRRPQQFTLHPQLTEPDGRTFALTEAYSAFAGLWMTLDTFWINHPVRDEVAARKVYQLQVAREVGLRVPETCITSSVARARDFIERRAQGRTLYKAFSGTERAWRESRLLESSELELLDAVKYAPVIFQEYIPAGVDLRITIVGEDVFAAAIHSQETEYKVDFRMTMDAARVEAVDLPPDVVARLHALMDRLGIVYGAVDMRRTPAGEHVFLEVNPAGQWLFIEQRTGQRISDAMTDLMVRHDTGSGARRRVEAARTVGA